MLSLESPRRGDYNEYTQYTNFNIKKKRKSPQSFPNLQPRDFSNGHKNEFETAVVNEPSVFEPLKIDYIVIIPYIAYISHQLLFPFCSFGHKVHFCTRMDNNYALNKYRISTPHPKYSRLSLSRSRRDPLKHFEISVLRHIRGEYLSNYQISH